MLFLYDHSVFNASLDSWQEKALTTFKQVITDKKKKFPCIPAYQGYLLNQFRFGFINDPRNNESIAQMAVLLKKYGEICRDLGNYSALILFFETPNDIKESYSVLDFEQLFWQIMNQLSLLDEEEWPEQISPDPSHHTWEFCFNKERYFFYCATPAHKERNSRYFPYLMLAITPRCVLDRFNHSPEKALKMKRHIRKRLMDYDTIPPHSDLKAYGEKDNQEWKQYFLRDDDTTISACPFHHRKVKEHKR
ncbi:YqcI/YcgG family protein [Heyndrickxia sporothermodurans]